MQEENTKYIIDSSFVLAHLLPDENVEWVDKIFKSYTEGKSTFIAPSLLPFEVINGIKYAVISKRIKAKNANHLINDFLNITINFHEVDFKKTFIISMQKNCSIYDSSYIFLANAYKIKLLTLDQKLIK